ncbi:MAG: hypothetical protein K6G40_07580 [Eubacterium sp.]|nr:hypothetical protein [Eubacterium sp.]
MEQQEKIENALRQIHVLFARCETVPGDEDKIIVDKKELFKLLEDINRCMYDMMDQYEVTRQSHERAVRKSREEGDKIIEESAVVAEDIYAAAILYTDEALGNIFESIKKTKEEINNLALSMSEELDRRLKKVTDNHSELKAQLMELTESDKYIKLIENENKKRKPESTLSVEDEVIERRFGGNYGFTDDLMWQQEPVRIMAPAPDIKVDPAYAEDAMLDDFDEGVVSVNTAPDIKVNYDSAYFKMKQAEAGITDDDFVEGVVEKEDE